MGIGPLPRLIEAGAASGFVGVELDRDGVLRRLPARDDLFSQRLLAGIPMTPAPADPARRLMRFLPDRHGFTRVSYYQALDPEAFLPPDLLRGAIVLVGLVVNTTPEPNQLPADSFLTPLLAMQDHLMAGVEVQANAVLNIAGGLLLRPAGGPARLGLLALFVAASSLALRSWTPAKAAAVLGGAVVAAIGIAVAAMQGAGIWLPPVLLMLGTVGTILAEGASSLVSERQGRRRIKDAFGRYLSPELVDILARDPSRLHLGGERRVMTFLFCDIRGFTNLSEQLQAEPERLTSIINRFLTTMTAAIRARRGTIDKFMGDCVMAFWNAPLDDPDHAGNALQCALEMVGGAGEAERRAGTRGRVAAARRHRHQHRALRRRQHGLRGALRLFGDGRRRQPGLAARRPWQALRAHHRRRRGYRGRGGNQPGSPCSSSTSWP